MSIFVGDEKVILEFEFRDYADENGVSTEIGAVDISTATEIVFLFQRPDGTSQTSKTLSGGKVVLSNGGTDGKAKYETETGFLDMAGVWKRQGRVTISGGVYHSKIVDLIVDAHL